MAKESSTPQNPVNPVHPVKKIREEFYRIGGLSLLNPSLFTGFPFSWE
jgi:hypothetical protein